MSTRIVLADDHAEYRESLARHLRRQGFDVVAEADNGGDAVRLAQLHHPDVVVLDFTMPVMTGVEAGQEICLTIPGVRVVILTAHADTPFLKHAIGSGIPAYVLKSRAASDLTAAIDAVCAGSTHYPVLPHVHS